MIAWIILCSNVHACQQGAVQEAASPFRVNTYSICAFKNFKVHNYNKLISFKHKIKTKIITYLC